MTTENAAAPPIAPEEFEAVVQSLLTAIEARDFKVHRHCERVAQFADSIAAQLQVSAVERQRLRYGALLHDIGNIGLPDSILYKPSALSKLEFDEVKLHPIIGEQIVRPLTGAGVLRTLIRHHHEKLDGSGYPDGLIGDEIPLTVKILSVVDVYDSLRSERPYREAFSHEGALDILLNESERGWWDAEIVALLAELNISDDDFAPV